MIVTTKLADIQKELERRVLNVSLKGHGSSSFLHVTNNGRGVEISEHGEHLWLEFWEKSDDEDAAPVKEMTAVGAEAVHETVRWLG